MITLSIQELYTPQMGNVFTPISSFRAAEVDLGSPSLPPGKAQTRRCERESLIHPLAMDGGVLPCLGPWSASRGIQHKPLAVP